MPAFRALAALLEEKRTPPVAAQPFAPPEPRIVEETPAPPVVAPAQVLETLKRFTAEFVRLRARAAELFEAEAERLLGDLARDVLGRELELAAPDLRALVMRARDEYCSSERMRVFVASDDLDLVRDLVEAQADPALVRGDLLLELADGTIDLRMGTRLREALGERSITVT